MSCSTVQSKLSAYLDGEVSGVEMLQLRSHINECRECRQELDGLRAVQSSLRDMLATPEPSELLLGKIQQSVAAARPNYRRLAFLVALPALCLALFVVSRPHNEKMQERSATINQEIEKDRIFDASSDPTTGASLVHYTNLEAR